MSLTKEDVTIINKVERNRRVKMGLLALVFVVLAYALAKIMGDESGDWWKFSLLTCALLGLKGVFLTITDVLGKK